MHSNDQEKQYEQKRLSEVLAEIERQKDEVLLKSGDIKESVVHLRRDFWEDVRVNLDNVDEMIETQASIRQQAELLSERERTHGQVHKQLKRLEQLEDSPYFGRIDFKEDGEKTEQIYIGRASLMDKDELEFLVYDWRAPISSMYYDFAPGRAYFQAMDGEIEGDILLKRQYMIEQGKLKGMFDTGLTIGDHLLQKALGGQASTKMKSIVATIQKEQNKVIRHEKQKFLIVQGVAGSGKTSAALQRVAYLLYRHRNLLDEKNMVLFSPNNLFSSYVSQVLPELGEENIQQTTFMQFIDRNIKSLKIESPFQQMEYVLTQQEDGNYSLRRENIAFKSSVLYKEIIDDYLAYLNEEGLIFNELLFRGKVFVSAQQMATYFAKLNPQLPIKNKVNLLSKWLREKVEELRKDQMNKDWVMEEIELLDDEVLTQVYYELQEKEEMEDFYDSGEEERYLQEKVVKEASQVLLERIDKLEFLNLVKTYELMFTSWSQAREMPKNWPALSKLTVRHLKEGGLFWEEATAFSYFVDEVIGSSANRSIRHIIIDEAQDYTPFQIAYLKHIFPHTNFTMLGDLNQAIYVETEEGNPLLTLSGEEVERISLVKSYRSTKEIIEFTKAFAPTGELIEAFDRHGEKPKVIKVAGQEYIKVIVEEVEKFKNEGHETIGIVCQTKKEAEDLHRKLSGLINSRQIDEKSKEFTKGVLILPIYLAKGIEFDAVIIPNGSRALYEEEDRTLFYTACTRAMHGLTIISGDNLSPLIEEADPATYELISMQIN